MTHPGLLVPGKQLYWGEKAIYLWDGQKGVLEEALGQDQWGEVCEGMCQKGQCN